MGCMVSLVWVGGKKEYTWGVECQFWGGGECILEKRGMECSVVECKSGL